MLWSKNSFWEIDLLFDFLTQIVISKAAIILGKKMTFTYIPRDSCCCRNIWFFIPPWLISAKQNLKKLTYEQNIEESKIIQKMIKLKNFSLFLKSKCTTWKISDFAFYFYFPVGSSSSNPSSSSAAKSERRLLLSAL